MPSDLDRWRLHAELGEAELRLGNEEAAIDQLIQAGRLLPKLKGQLPPLVANQTLFRLGVAYIRPGGNAKLLSRRSWDSEQS